MPIYSIVGDKFHPPARAILAVIPLGQELELIPEPENPYDPNAIAVWINGHSIHLHITDEVESIFQGYGYSSDDILSDDWHLGYIPRELAKNISLSGPTPGKFCLGHDGGPRVEFESFPSRALGPQ